MRSRLDRVLGLDLRAVATLRILSALLVLVSLAERIGDFIPFYTDAGVLPQAEAWTGRWFVPWDGTSWLHPFVWLPDPWSSVALFAAAAVAAMFLLFGWKTKPATFLAWVMLTGIDNRNPLVINSGDDALRMLLFWGLFLPLSACWSEDARSPRRARHWRRSNRVVNVGTTAFLVQLALVYLMSALLKSYRLWVTDGDALHYALHLEQFVTPIGIAVRDRLPLAMFSRATWWLELAGPLLLFSPYATEWLRYFLFATFAILHLGIDLTLGLGLFSYVCIAAWSVTLPTAFWGRVERFLRLAEAPANGEETAPTRRDLRAADILAGCFLGYVLLWNLWSLNPKRHPAWFPDDARWPGYQLRLGQLWGMFSPGAPKESSWLETAAQTFGGTVYWLGPDGRLCNGSPATPERVLSERWRKLHERIVQAQSPVLNQRYAEFLLGRFERSRPGTPARVTIVSVRKASPPPVPSSEPEARERAELLATAGLPLGGPAPRWLMHDTDAL